MSFSHEVGTALRVQRDMDRVPVLMELMFDWGKQANMETKGMISYQC